MGRAPLSAVDHPLFQRRCVKGDPDRRMVEYDENVNVTPYCSSYGGGLETKINRLVYGNLGREIIHIYPFPRNERVVLAWWVVEKETCPRYAC